MRAETHKSENGWLIPLPPGFVVQHLDQDHTYSDFVNGQDPSLSFSWAILPGRPVDPRCDWRFKRMVDGNAPLDVRQLPGVLNGIAPPSGDLRWANTIDLADGARALELISEGPIWTYMLLFPCDPQRVTTEVGAATLSEWFPDPVTGEPLEYAPQVLHRAFTADGALTEWLGLGHDRYERLLFAADAQRFQRWLPTIQPSIRAFHYGRKPLMPWQLERTWPTYESWFSEHFPDLAPAVGLPG